MSLFNLLNASKAVKENAVMMLEHIDLAVQHTLQVLRDTVRSERGINRGDLRSSLVLFSTPVDDDHAESSARKSMWQSVDKDTGLRSYKQVLIAGWPTFTFGQDQQELELEDSDSALQSVNGLLVSSSDGPMIVSWEFGTSTAAPGEDVSCSSALTVFWDQDPSTPILSTTLDKVTALLHDRLQPGYHTKDFHVTKDLIKDVKAAVADDDDNGLSLVSMTVSLCHTVRSLTALDDDEDGPHFVGQLVKGDMVGVLFRAIITLSDGNDYAVGFERMVKVETEPSVYFPSYVIVNKLRTEKLSMWLASSMMLDLSVSGTKIPAGGWPKYNVHYDPTVPAPPGCTGNRGLPKEVKNRISEADEAIRQAFEVTLGFDRMTTAALVNHSLAKNSMVGHDFSFVAVDLLGRLFNRFQQHRKTSNAFAKHTVRYKYSAVQMSSWKKRMLTGFSRRTGEWDETTDGPALGQAVFRVCKLFMVTPAEVCSMIISGLSAVAPSSLKLGSRFLLRRGSNEPKLVMFILYFGILSRRLTPWDSRDFSPNPLLRLVDVTRTMVRKHVDSFVPEKRKEQIRVDNHKHQVIIKSVLNDAAKSKKPPFATLGIKQDDWDTWDHLYSRSGTTGPNDPVYLAVYLALLKAFPDSPTFGRKRGTRIVQRFLDITVSEKALKSLGRLDLAGRMITRADICAYATLMYMLRVDPRDARFYETKLPAGYIDIFRAWLPHQRQLLDHFPRRLRSSLIDAYQAIEDLEEDARRAAFLTLMSESDLEIVMGFRERRDM